MQLLALVAAAAVTPLAFAQQGARPTFYGLQYNMPQGTMLIQSTGSMTVPHLTRKGCNYFWPGLQPPIEGVLQPVLSGCTGSWTVYNTWYEDWMPPGPGEAGPSHNISEGQVMNYNMQQQADGAWKSTLNIGGMAETWTDTFAQMSAAKANSVNVANFEVEIWDNGPWDFGPLKFSDLTMVANSTDKSWCSETPTFHDKTIVSVSGVTSSVQNGHTSCKIASLILERPV